MKTSAIHKRFYTALPRPPASTTPVTAPIPSRVRSNSASSSRSLYTASQSAIPFAFFDSPPPQVPSSRPNSTNLAVSTRLAAEVKPEVENHAPYSNNGQNSTPQSHSQHGGPPPYSLAFTSGQSEASSSHIPASHFNPFFPYQSFSSALNQAASTTTDPTNSPKRQRTRYHLDVGAYGIPKHSRSARVAGRDGGRGGKVYKGTSTRAVQVGEDAYFIRDNAMGVADGVGGWSKTRRSAERGEELSPSALFANRLMHYCCEEVDAALSLSAEFDPDLNEQLDDSLEDLAEGLDVLMVLERAYDKTIKAHVRPLENSGTNSKSGMADNQASAMDTHTANTPPLSSNKASQKPSPLNAPPRSISTSPERAISSVDPAPLLQGSSTALVAILEHPAPRTPKPAKPTPLFHPSPRYLGRETPTPNVADPGAVIRIAHLGDSMGMLIRGEEIVWRTEEMWWNFNTPVQLGPSSSTRPVDARVFTIPVEQDDILILASDGLSDNLWDEDILDEVVRFRQSYLSSVPIPCAESKKSLGASLRRGTLAGLLSEALCSRARCVSERRGYRSRRGERGAALSPHLTSMESEDEIPFGRRAREMGRAFSGGKPDDISVLVAVVSPVE